MTIKNTALDKELGLKDTLALAFGCMIGWGWVVLVGEWISVAGSMGAIGGFLAAGAILVVIGLLYAELAAAMPMAGGAQNYCMRAFGRWPAFICSWALVLGYVSITVFEAVALPQVAEYFVGPLDQGYLWTIANNDVYLTYGLMGAAGAIVIGLLNVRGVKTAALFQTLVTLVILAAGVMLFTGATFEGNADNLSPYFVNGVTGSIVAVMVMAPFLMGGFDVIPQAASEINLPAAKLGKLIVVAVVAGAAWYCAVIFSVSMIFDGKGLAAANLPAVDAAGKAWGQIGWQVLIIGGLAGILTSWNGFLVGGSRAVYALAREGMLPAFFAQLHPKYRTPTNAIWTITALGCIGPFFGKQLLIWVSNAGSLGFVLAYLFVALSFIKLRKSEPNMPRPYKVPYGMFFGVVGLLGALGMTCLYLPGSNGALLWPNEWLIAGLWFAFGFAAFIYASKKSALQRAISQKTSTGARQSKRVSA